MALNDPTKTLESRIDIQGAECGSGESQPEEKELEKLESDVKQMAQKILEYRATLPEQLKNTFSLILSAERPVLPVFEYGSGPGPSGELNPDSGGHVESSMPTTLVEEQWKASEKIHMVKDKISSNMSAMPTLMRRMKECISKIDELDSYSGIIHPSFKKKKPG